MFAAPADLDAFEAKFRRDPDPWATWAARDERVKRTAILRALGPHRHARVLEIGSGNGSNSVPLARRALRLLALDGAPRAVELTAAALAPHTHAQARLARLPGDVPGVFRGQVSALVAAEVLYYLPPRDLRQLARRLLPRLARGATVVLAHHRVPFSDAAQAPARVHGAFHAALAPRRPGALQPITKSRMWRVERFRLDSPSV